MTQAKTGDTVTVHYTGRLGDGTVFDTSIGRDPLNFKIGDGQLIPDFEEAVVGMSPEESKTITIPSDKAYGPHHAEMVLEVEKKHFPEDLEPRLEQQLQVSQPDGRAFVAKVTDISETTVTLDTNHPLAGKDLTFDIQLTEVA